MAPTEVADPDIVIGRRDGVGIVAANHSKRPAAAHLLNALGFERTAERGLYALTAGNQPEADRAAQAVAILRAAKLDVAADVAFEPEPGTLRAAAPAQAPRLAKVPTTAHGADVAFGMHPTDGITAAFTDNHPNAAMVLGVAGFRRAKDLDVYTLPAGTDPVAASESVRAATQVLRATGSTVHILPGTLTDPKPEPNRSAVLDADKPWQGEKKDRAVDVAEVLDGPTGARALVDALRRLLRAAAAWSAARVATLGPSLAERLTDAATRLEQVGASLDAASDRLRSGRPAEAVTDPAPATKQSPPPVEVEPQAFDAFVGKGADAATISRALDQLTSQTGPLANAHRLVDSAAQRCAELPGELGAELSTELAASSRRLGNIGHSLLYVSDHLADTPAATPFTTPVSARAAAARSTTRTGAAVAPTPTTPAAAQPARTPADNARSR
ncbi:hypothetical protein [Streptomyces sp. SID3343]|uniref:hypothetical protein n=1 Tax=Streptomyces sp. SID3343 TaxID=2690260 RepID=UPI00136C7C57|nr:hypothetical protein [Streptomyces sp. SID3343]MYW03375.1 hypothetical protein [Streptomyces sp. SID3343]MYW06219.1 hypothetical protein [Streptomyces sp. SID3343]